MYICRRRRRKKKEERRRRRRKKKKKKNASVLPVCLDFWSVKKKKRYVCMYDGCVVFAVGCLFHFVFNIHLSSSSIIISDSSHACMYVCIMYGWMPFYTGTHTQFNTWTSQHPSMTMAMTLTMTMTMTLTMTMKLRHQSTGRFVIIITITRGFVVAMFSLFFFFSIWWKHTIILINECEKHYLQQWVSQWTEYGQPLSTWVLSLSHTHTHTHVGVTMEMSRLTSKTLKMHLSFSLSLFSLYDALLATYSELVER